MLVTRVIDHVDEANTDVDRWRELAVAAGNLFVTPEWTVSWLRVYEDRYEPRIVLCHRGDELVGVLPLVVERRWPRALRFAGDASADRTAPVVAPEHAATAAAALLEAAYAIAPSIVVLTHLDSAVAETAVRARSAVRGRIARLPYADLGDGWDAYLGRRSRNFRADLKRKERSLRQAHQVGLRRTASSNELDGDLGVFFRLHDERWDERGGSASSSTRVRAFLHEVSKRCLERGWLRLWQLEADGEPAASFLGWSVGPRYSYYLAGFESRFARHSPGTVLLAHTIQEAVSEGCARYDLLLGDESYKSRFADGDEAVESLVVASSSSLPFFLARAEAAGRHALRRLPDRPRAALQQAAAKAGSRLPLTRSR